METAFQHKRRLASDLRLGEFPQRSAIRNTKTSPCRLCGHTMLRIFDIFLSTVGLIAASPLLVVLTVLGWFDTGSPFFRQTRVGRDQKPFTLVKFRTMQRGTAHVATHLADASAVTPFGSFLRRTKLDELPQLWNVLKGEMSLVGPRPCLPSQAELIAAREASGVFRARPGITGLAQVQGIDMSAPSRLARTDAAMMTSLGLRNYWRFILVTLLGHGAGDRVVPTNEGG
jgi:O-antigen biosynthesis protein WbqP